MKKAGLLFAVAALLVACSQPEIDEAAVEAEVDSVATDAFDALNEGFEDEEESESAEENAATDSLADAAMNAVLDESAEE